jgi:hypothetical protein
MSPKSYPWTMAVVAQPITYSSPRGRWGIGGISGGSPGSSEFTSGYRQALMVSAALCVAGGMNSLLFIRDQELPRAHVPPSIDNPCECDRGEMESPVFEGAASGD